MEIRVSGHQIDTGAALKQHVQDRLQGIADKYFSRAISSQVTFGKGPHESFTCDIVSHVMKDLVLKGHNESMDAHSAFDGAADKIEKQLRRYMRRLKDRNAGAVIAEVESRSYENADYRVFEPSAEEEEASEDAPLIIAETRTDIPDASVSDAVMMLDLRNTAALMFRNIRTGAYNMVYRRHDGSIGWVEPDRG